jgi:hypothetical protein
MATTRVTIVDQSSSESRKLELASRLRDALISPDDNLRDQTQWRVIAEVVNEKSALDQGPDRRFATLDAAAWHDHLAGIRRWIPSGS